MKTDDLITALRQISNRVGRRDCVVIWQAVQRLRDAESQMEQARQKEQAQAQIIRALNLEIDRLREGIT